MRSRKLQLSSDIDILMVEYGDDTAMTWVWFPVDVLFLILSEFVGDWIYKYDFT